MLLFNRCWPTLLFSPIHGKQHHGIATVWIHSIKYSHLSVCLFIYLGRDNSQEEVDQAGLKGFIGCLSSVQFNHVAPLKAALLNRGSSLVTVRGPLVQSNCGALADSITSHNLRGNTHCQSRNKQLNSANQKPINK